MKTCAQSWLEKASILTLCWWCINRYLTACWASWLSKVHRPPNTL